MHREFYICSCLIADIAIQGGIWLTSSMIDAIAAGTPLILTSLGAAEAFRRVDAIQELAAMPEDSRHRMFIIGFRRISLGTGTLAILFEKMLEEDSAVVAQAFRDQWPKRSSLSAFDGHESLASVEQKYSAAAKISRKILN